MKYVAMVCLLLMSSSVIAQERDYYVGVGWGGTNFKSKSFDVAIPSGPTVASVVDDSDSNFRIYGGYRLSPNLALEAVITDMGEWEQVDTANNFTATFEGSSVDLAVVGLYPIGDGTFELFARGGVAIWSLDTELEATGALPGTPTFATAPADSGEDLFWAAGVNINGFADKAWTFRTQLISYEISEFEELAQFAFDFQYSF